RARATLSRALGRARGALAVALEPPPADPEGNGLPVCREFDLTEWQFAGFVSLPGCCRKRRSQLGVVESRLRGELHRIENHEARARRVGIAVPQALVAGPSGPHRVIHQGVDVV